MPKQITVQQLKKLYAYRENRRSNLCMVRGTEKAVSIKKRKSETGYVQEVTVYECFACKGCPVKEKCIRQKKTDTSPLEDRVKQLNVAKYFTAQREAIEQKTSTKEGILLRINRSIQAEGVFSMIKQDMSFRRFLTRGTKRHHNAKNKTAHFFER